MRVAASCAAVAVALATGIAAAQPEPTPSPAPEEPAPSPEPKKPTPEEVANAHLERGTGHYLDANLIAALGEFRGAYNVMPSWEALNGIALTLMDMDKAAEAYATFQKMLLEFDAEFTDDQKEIAQGFLKDLEPRIARIIVELSAENRGAQITLDGGELAESDLGVPQLVDPGTRALVATLEGFEPHAEKVDALAGRTITVSIKLAAKKERVVIELKEKELVRRMPRWIPWAALAGGAVLGGAGGLFALSAKSSFDDFDRGIAQDAGGLPNSVPADVGDRDSAETKKLIATGLFVGAGAAIAAGVVLVILNQPRAAPEGAGKDATTTLLVTPHSIGVALRF